MSRISFIGPGRGPGPGGPGRPGGPGGPGRRPGGPPPPPPGPRFGRGRGWGPQPPPGPGYPRRGGCFVPGCLMPVLAVLALIGLVIGLL